MVKQIIVVNKELNMSKGKLASQVSHASMAILTKRMTIRPEMYTSPVFDQDSGKISGYTYGIYLDNDAFEWCKGSFTKIILETENEQSLNDLIEKAKENGMKEDVDFFCIRDNCLTELMPDESGTRLTCVGFKPMDAKRIDKITKSLKLFKD